MSRTTALFLLFAGVLILRSGRSVAIDSPWRLPGHITPHAYSIHLTTHVHTQTDFTYSGDVNITLSATIAAPSITVHVKELHVTSVLIWPTANVSAIRHPIETRYNDTTDMLRVLVNGTTGGALLPHVEYVMRLRFVGTLRDDLRGFYKVPYQDALGNDRWLATTQFEAIDARRAFPCLDEPALRAKFTVRITHGSNYTAMSNMPVDGSPSISGDGQMTTTIFETTPPMPTYLLAITVSDFRCKSAGSASTAAAVRQSVCARPDVFNTTQLDFTIEMGARLLAAFEQYFGVPYALPKIDQVLLPTMRPAAMENWGLVNYRENELMHASDSTNNQLQSAYFIAHEYAHQWFGNQVTPKWWSHIWLSEGFATLFASISVDWILPEIGFHKEFKFISQRGVLAMDANNGTNAMSRELETTGELSITIFANIVTYHKAACVLRMFLHAFTEERFKKGLTLYLNKFKNSAADERDLFNALEEAMRPDGNLPNVHVATLMSSWTQQAGFPLVTVTRNYDTGELTIAQEQYTDNIAKTMSTRLKATQPWWIPVNFASASQADFNHTKPDFWMGERNITQRLPDLTLKSTDWLLLNKRQTGYYRVRYDAQNYKQLAAGLLECRDCFHVSSRSQLIDDAFELAKSGRLGYDAAFDIIKFLQIETDYIPWMSADPGLEHVHQMLAGTEWFDDFARLMSRLLARVYNENGFVGREGDTADSYDARNKIVHWACRYGNAQCLNETRAAVTAHLSATGQRLHPAHQSAVMCGALRHHDSAQLFDELVTQLQRSRDAAEQSRLIAALACSGRADRLDVLLMLSVNLTTLKEDERIGVWTQVWSTGSSEAAAAISFINDHFEEVESSSAGYIQSAAQQLAYGASTERQMREFDRFIEVAHGSNFTFPDNFEHELRMRIQENMVWMNRNAEVIHLWIEANHVQD